MINAIIRKLNLKLLYVCKIFIMIVISFLISQFIISLQNVERNVNTLPMSIIDNDGSILSKSFCSTMRTKSNVNIIVDESQGISKLASGEIDLLLVINKGYENSISDGEITNLFNVYSGYNPEYTNMLLEIISEEVLKEWVTYKIESFNKDKDLEIMWDELENDYNFVEIKEIIIEKDESVVKDNNIAESNMYEKTTYIIVGIISSVLILLFLGEKVIREKLSGMLKRTFIFQPQGKKIYLLNSLIDVVVIFIISSSIYGIALYIYGVSFIQLFSLGIMYLVYLIFVQAFVYLIIYLSNSLVIYNVLGFFYIIINLIIIVVSLVL